VISRQVDARARPVAFEIMDDLRALPKYPDAGRPLMPVRLVEGHGGWWLECPATGDGYWYRSLREAVRRWRVDVVGWADGAWLAEPWPRTGRN
jgi:hypothetical protein